MNKSKTGTETSFAFEFSAAAVHGADQSSRCPTSEVSVQLQNKFESIFM